MEEVETDLTERQSVPMVAAMDTQQVMGHGDFTRAELSALQDIQPVE